MLATLLPSLLCSGGCASPGPPRAPSLNLPETASSLTVDRVGDDVVLHWTTSAKTTDGLDVRGAMTAEVCRGVAGMKLPDAPCSIAMRFPVKSGPSMAMDRLPVSLLASPPQAIFYKVSIRNQRERTAGESSPAWTASGPAPATVEDLTVVATAGGALLRWQPIPGLDRVELLRTREQDGSESQASKNAAEARLDVVPSSQAADGSLDRTVTMGKQYTYNAQRKRLLTLGKREVEIRSALSPAVTVAMRDVFPPEPPVGLVAVSDGTSVDLSWRPNTEPDLVGYLVFREELTPGTGAVALNTKPLAGSSLHDASVVSGHTYRYSIVAVDHAGNRSAPGDVIEQMVRSQ